MKKVMCLLCLLDQRTSIDSIQRIAKRPGERKESRVIRLDEVVQLVVVLLVVVLLVRIGETTWDRCRIPTRFLVPVWIDVAFVARMGATTWDRCRIPTRFLVPVWIDVAFMARMGATTWDR